MKPGPTFQAVLANLPTMLIGFDFFRAHRVLIANREHLLLFSYNGGPVFQTEARPSDPPPAASARGF